MIETERLIISMLPPTEAASVAAFQRSNREFLSAQEPVRPKDFYTEEYWRRRLAEIEVSAKEDKCYRSDVDLTSI